MFIRPQQYESIVSKKEYLTSKVVELTLQLKKPETMTFIPGQFVSIEVDDGEYRSYSITSEEQDHNNIRLLIETGHQGKGADFTRNLKVGDIVKFIGPSGKFTLPPLLPPHMFFISTGVGFAPFESMIRKLITDGYTGKIDLYFGIRSNDELFKLDFLKQAKKDLNDFHHVLCFSRQVPNNGYSGRVTKLLSENTDLEICKNTGTLFLICGNPAMVTDTISILQKAGINSHQILFEKFS